MPSLSPHLPPLPPLTPLPHPTPNTPMGSSCKWQRVPTGYCLTFNTTTCTITLGFCPYVLRLDNQTVLYDISGSIKVLVSNCSAINSIVCGPLHRTGLLCSRCENGFGLALYSRNFQCVECSKSVSSAKMWILYLAMEIIPLLCFYLAVVVFDIQVATPPFTAYVFYCQLLSQMFRYSGSIRLHFNTYSSKQLLVFTLTVLDVWNLDFFRHIIPPFCVSSKISNVDAVLLEFASALFPLLLVILTYVAMELHARDVRIIVKLWKPFHRFFVCCRRSWNPQASIVNAFATFMMLSLSKLMFLCMYASTQTELLHSTATKQHFSDMHSLNIDPYTKLRDVPSLMYSGVAILIFLLILPSFLLFLYPVKVLRKVACFKCLYRSQGLWFFMEAFQGHYRHNDREGQWRGGCNYRFFAVLQFVNRLFISLTLINMWSSVRTLINRHYYVVTLYLIGMSMFYSLARPYNRRYMNIIEGLLYGFTAGVVLDVISVSLYYKQDRKVHCNVLLVVMVTPSMVLMVIVLWRLLRKGCGYVARETRVGVALVGAVRGVARRKGVAEEAEDASLLATT